MFRNSVDDSFSLPFVWAGLFHPFLYIIVQTQTKDSVDREEDNQNSGTRLVVFLPQSNANNSRSRSSASTSRSICIPPSRPVKSDAKLREASPTATVSRHLRCDICGYVENCVCGLPMTSAEWLVMWNSLLHNVSSCLRKLLQLTVHIQNSG